MAPVRAALDKIVRGHQPFPAAIVDRRWDLASGRPSGDLASRLFVPLVIVHRGQQLRLFSTVVTFGTALDITVAELSIESFFRLTGQPLTSWARAACVPGAA